MNILTSIILQTILFILPVSQQGEKSDRILVYGDDFLFGVKEPTGWHGDTDSAANYSANIIFTRPDQDSTSPYGIIRVCVNDKVDENTVEDLAYDMKEYKQKYAGIKFGDLPVQHSKYKCFSKIFFIEKDFYEYVTYINPGKEFTYALSVSLSKKDVRATEEELSAYKVVVSSLLCSGK